MSEFLDVQPSSCRKPLFFDPPDLKLSFWRRAVLRLNGFDPTAIYERLAPKLNPYTRDQKINWGDQFPNVDQDGKCVCGCGEALTGKKQKYASDICKLFCLLIWQILKSRTDDIGKILSFASGREGYHCINCSCNDCSVEIDHIVGIKQGGGASWLTNYQILCHTCHVDKTNRDFKRGQYADPKPPADPNQTQLFT